MPQRSLRDRIRGQRQSRNIEDRRDEKMVVDDESDKYPVVYQWPPPMSEDINEPLETHSLGSHIPTYQARRDLVTQQKAMRKPPYDRARIDEIKRPTRRKRKVQY